MKRKEKRPHAIRYFKCALTNKRYRYDQAMQHRMTCLLSAPRIAELINTRLPSISPDDAIKFYVPVAKGLYVPQMHVNQFVNFIQLNLNRRSYNIKAYETFCSNRAIAANQSAPVQETLHRSRPNITVAEHPDENVNEDVREAIRRSLAGNDGNNNNVLGSSVSSTSDSENETESHLNTRAAIRRLLSSDNESNISENNLDDNLEIQDADFEGIVAVVPPNSNTESNLTPNVSNVARNDTVATDSNEKDDGNATTRPNNETQIVRYNTDIEHEDDVVIDHAINPPARIINNTVSNTDKNDSNNVPSKPAPPPPTDPITQPPLNSDNNIPSVVEFPSQSQNNIVTTSNNVATMPSQAMIEENQPSIDRDNIVHTTNNNAVGNELDNNVRLTNFIDKPEHQAICISILSDALAVGYENL